MDREETHEDEFLSTTRSQGSPVCLYQLSGTGATSVVLGQPASR